MSENTSDVGFSKELKAIGSDLDLKSNRSVTIVFGYLEIQGKIHLTIIIHLTHISRFFRDSLLLSSLISGMENMEISFEKLSPFP
jgi:hypothetical protein